MHVTQSGAPVGASLSGIPAAGTVWTLAGKGSEDPAPAWGSTGTILLRNGEARADLPPVSIIVPAFRDPPAAIRPDPTSRAGSSPGHPEKFTTDGRKLGRKVRPARVGMRT